MKYSKIYLLFITLIIAGCSSSAGIIQKNYNYEKLHGEGTLFTFNFHLENFNGSNNTADLIRRLVYQNKNFYDFIKYKEAEFMSVLYEPDCKPIPLQNEDGTWHIADYRLTEKYTIDFYNDSHIIIKSLTYSYYAGEAHGTSQTRYIIIDIEEEKTLDAEELITPIPDNLLKSIIESKYNSNAYLRWNIWPADTVNFCNGNIELIWNAYSIMPYVTGTITIEIPDAVIEQYLTDKGKELKISSLMR